MTTVADLRARNVLPWPAPTSAWDDDGEECMFAVDGHLFDVQGTGLVGMDSGRRRWRVRCVTCDVELHRATTSATAQIAWHLEEVAERK